MIRLTIIPLIPDKVYIDMIIFSSRVIDCTAIRSGSGFIQLIEILICNIITQTFYSIGIGIFSCIIARYRIFIQIIFCFSTITIVRKVKANHTAYAGKIIMFIFFRFVITCKRNIIIRPRIIFGSFFI